MLTIHDPSKMKERQNVKPLTMEEEIELIEELCYVADLFSTEEHQNLMQRFIHRYENLLHMEACQCKVITDKTI